MLQNVCAATKIYNNGEVKLYRKKQGCVLSWLLVLADIHHCLLEYEIISISAHHYSHPC